MKYLATARRVPSSAEAGQIWRDNDQRSKGAGEFTVEDVDDTHATVRRHESGRRSRILLSRLLKGGPRGYTYIGRQR